ncbi:uncharacterized protein LOC110035958, partial [Phalaenopsis equestris]|uniref:uncharacterized protein LOC110035958 n=1 Tax=Phalaenopsis equestris TaxID=78828 RepID=UPI0009E5CB02
MKSLRRHPRGFPSFAVFERPIIEGGLGFKDFQHLSVINLCKLWINFRAQDILWALFMKGKYCRTVQPNLAEKKVGDSRLWTKLLEVRHQAEDLFVWELGEGQINFWLDKWIWNGERIDTSNPNFGTKVKEFWTENQRNCNLLETILTEEQMYWVKKTKINPGEKDRIVTKQAPSQKLSAYIFQQLYHWQHVMWGKFIWGKWLTPSMSFSCWTLWKSFLPCDDILKLKGLRGPSCCWLCSKDEESLEHLYSPVVSPKGFGLVCSISSALILLKNHVKYENMKCLDKALVLNCTFYPHKIILHQKFPNNFQIWMPSGIDMKISNPTLVLWTPPLKGWLKANTDGSFSKEAAGVGGVIRNYQGKCIFYYSSPAWANDALETEMITIFWAIYLSKQCNIYKLVIESDSSSFIRILKNVEAAPWNLVWWHNNIKSLLIKVDVHFQHIHREGNTPAHSLVVRGKEIEEIVVGTIPPNHLQVKESTQPGSYNITEM